MFDWAIENQRDIPELAMLFAVPNGAHKSIVVAVKFRREGIRSGVPDVALSVPRSPFCGLFIEMKSPGRDANPGLGLSERKSGMFKTE